jgi:excisionase family DNA binding protein
MSGRARETLTSTEAGELLGVSAATVKRWSDEGALPSIRTRGGHRRFRRADVEEVAARQRGQDGVHGPLAERLAAGESVLRVQADLLAERARGGSWRAVVDECVSVLGALSRSQRAAGAPYLGTRVAHATLSDALARCAEEMPFIPGAPTALVAAVEDEDFTVALALARLAARSAGWRVWSVGAVPTAELVAFATARAVDAILLFASVARSRVGVVEDAAALEAACAASGVALALVGGGAWAPVGSARIVRSFGEIPDYLDAISGRRP